MSEILLSDGQVTHVDDADFSRVSDRRWYPHAREHATYATDADGNYLHRIIVRAQPGEKVDHRNGDGLDNRRTNLRVCTQAQNNANTRRRRSSKSGFKGVHWYQPGKCWRAQCRHKHVGYYPTAEEAARAYDDRAVSEFGEFALLNFPAPLCVS